jgi:hypothetical protein
MSSNFDSNSFAEVIEVTTVKSNNLLIGFLIGGLVFSVIIIAFQYDKISNLEDDNRRLNRRIDKKL